MNTHLYVSTAYLPADADINIDSVLSNSVPVSLLPMIYHLSTLHDNSISINASLRYFTLLDNLYYRCDLKSPLKDNFENCWKIKIKSIEMNQSKAFSVFFGCDE